MLNISIICFSLTGEITATEIARILTEAGHKVELAKKSKYLSDSIRESLGEWTGVQFEQKDAIIFVGACGIAVRSVAPYVKKKTHDPAVLVIDECKKHVISLLSGHIGGANELTRTLAFALGADPVITTATDLHHQFAVDVFATKHRCAIKNMTAAKLVSADLLAGETIGLYCEFPMEGQLPKQLVLCDRNGVPLDQETKKPETGIVITVKKQCKPFDNTVILIPQVLTMGIGCKKNTQATVIINEIEERLLKVLYYAEAFSGIASIDLKKEEAGIIALAEKYNLPFNTYTTAELLEVEGDFTESSFVQSITGVSNVCERSAVKASGNGNLIERKIGFHGVTTAVACAEWRIYFE